MSLPLRSLVVLGVALAFVACDSSERRRRRGGNDDAAGQAGEAGAPAPAAGSSGRAGASAGAGAGGRGGASAAGGSGGSAAGEGGGDDSGGTSSGGSGNTAGQGATGGAGGSGGGAPVDPCAGVECSGRGECVADGAVPRCECDAGYGPVGLECVECPLASDTFDIDVPMVTVTGSLSVNGDTVAEGEAALLFYTEAGDAPGATFDGPSAYTAELLPMTYAVVYSLRADDAGLPDNTFATLREDVAIEDSVTLDLDVPMVTVTGSITVNGDVPGTAGDANLLFLREGMATVAGTLSAPDYSVELVAGTYDIAYAVTDRDASIPSNEQAILERGVTLEADATLDVDIPMVVVSGDITVNGEATTTSAETRVVLKNSGGDTAELGNVNSGSFSAGVVPGTFDLVYSSPGEDGVVPQNSNAILLRNVELESDATLDVDVPMVTISGDLTVNGATLVTAPNAGRLSLTNATDFVDIAYTSLPTYVASIVPGTYRVLYMAQSLTSGDGLPDNQNAVLTGDLVLDADESLDIDIPLAVVTGNVRVNGAAPSGSGAANFFFMNRDTGDTVIAGFLTSATYTGEFVPGTYDVFYSNQLEDGVIPANRGARVLEAVEITGDRALDLDVPLGVTLSGALTVNGEPAPSPGEAAILLQRGAVESLELGTLGDSNYETVVLPGTYTLLYELRTPGAGIPSNTRSPFACVRVE